MTVCKENKYTKHTGFSVLIKFSPPLSWFLCVEIDSRCMANPASRRPWLIQKCLRWHQQTGSGCREPLTSLIDEAIWRTQKAGRGQATENKAGQRRRNQASPEHWEAFHYQLLSPLSWCPATLLSLLDGIQIIRSSSEISEDDHWPEDGCQPRGRRLLLVLELAYPEAF